MRLLQLILFPVLSAATQGNSTPSASPVAIRESQDEPFDKGICHNERAAHAYMSKMVKPYGECFRNHFFTFPISKVCSKTCLDSVIRASQFVQAGCMSDDLTEDEYESKYKKKSYKPWSSRKGAEAMCGRRDESIMCMADLQAAETLLAYQVKCKKYTEKEKKVICSPCVEKMYGLYYDHPTNSPFINSHQISEVKQIFANINCTCEFTPKGRTAKEWEKDDMLNPGLDYGLMDIR